MQEKEIAGYIAKYGVEKTIEILERSQWLAGRKSSAIVDTVKKIAKTLKRD